jgi:heme ABC exporter ATP-binding subunit CcmA
MSLAVSVRGATVTFGETRAIRNVDLEVPAGAVCAVVGPNGAGKTSLLRILAGLLTPDRGSVRVGSLSPPAGPTYRREIGYVGHTPLLYLELSVRENLELFARLHGVMRPFDRIRQLASQFGIESFLDRRVATLSRGMAQRATLARATLHDPRVLLLDEPTAGLDADSVGRLPAILRRGDGSARTIIAATHDAAFVERFATMTARMSGGSLESFDGRASTRE